MEPIIKKTPAEIMRERTKDDMLNKLTSMGRVALIRPTGAGKTWMLAMLTREYKGVLFIYPSEGIKDTAIYVLDNMEDIEEAEDSGMLAREEMNLLSDNEDESTAMRVLYKLSGEKNLAEEMISDNIADDEAETMYGNVRFMTYMKLIRLSDDEIKQFSDFDLIIFDECHRMGARESSIACDKLFKFLPNAHFIGATATPIRTDSTDVVRRFFLGSCVDEYTIHDAVQDGIIKRPLYSSIISDAETDLKEAALMAGQDYDNPIVKEVLAPKLIELGKLYNVPTILKDISDNAYVDEEGQAVWGEGKEKLLDNDYQKYIVFFANISQLNHKCGSVKRWFKKAFPHLRQRTLSITSEDGTRTENVHKLQELKRKEGVIDLIFCVNMLNEGVHLEDLTGIVMYRATASNIVFAQQFGRALSSGAEKPCIVIDVVDNLHRKALYDVYSGKPDMGVQNKKAGDTNRVPLPNGELVRIEDDGTYKDSNGIVHDLYAELGISKDKVSVSRLKQVLRSEAWYTNCNKLTDSDITATHHLATYTELLVKLVGESEEQRAKAAAMEWIRHWCRINNYPFPLKRAYYLSNDDTFKAEIQPPLEAFAKFYGNITPKVFVDAILEEGSKGLEKVQNSLEVKVQEIFPVEEAV